MVGARFPQPPPGLGFNLHDEPVVCSRRGDLMSNVPSGQVAVFPALTLDMQCVLVGLRSKTSLNRPCGSGFLREITSHRRPRGQIRYDPLLPEDAQSIPVDEGPWRCVLLGLCWVADHNAPQAQR